MKFVCDKCKTKYSIADDKVRRKVLKIRCKNCSNIIIVKEPVKSHIPAGPTISDQNFMPGAKPFAKALDGAFKGMGSKTLSNALQSFSPMEALGEPDPSIGEGARAGFDPEPTRLSTQPQFTEGAGPLDDEWYLAVDGNQYGPMSFSELCSRVKRGEAGNEAYVWRDFFDDWKDVQEIPELRGLLPRHPPPPPRGKSGLIHLPSLLQQGYGPADQGQAPYGPSPSSSMPPSRMTPPVPSGPSMNPPSQVRPLPQRPMMPTPPPPSVSQPAYQEQPSHSGVPYYPTPADSDIRPLPPIYSHSSEAMAPPLQVPVHPQQTNRTPLWMVVAGVGGGLAAICGIFLVVYFLFFDRPAKEEPHSMSALAMQSYAQPPAEAQPTPDAAVESIEFVPIAVERSKKKHVAARPSRPQKPVANKTGGGSDEPANLTDQQRRLMQLYGLKGGPSGGTALNVSAKRSSGPSRRITAGEILGFQKQNKRSLQACYERALKRDESLAEIKADITVTIGDSGVVQSVDVKAGDNADFNDCIRRVFKRGVFPAIGQQSFAFPIIFRGT